MHPILTFLGFALTAGAAYAAGRATKPAYRAAPFRAVVQPDGTLEAEGEDPAGVSGMMNDLRSPARTHR